MIPASTWKAAWKPSVSATAAWRAGVQRARGVVGGDGDERGGPDRAADLLSGGHQTGGQAAVALLGVAGPRPIAGTKASPGPDR